MKKRVCTVTPRAVTGISCEVGGGIAELRIFRGRRTRR
jgi:hypothetical protein